MKFIIIILIMLSSCNTLKNLKPSDYIYIVKDGKPCFWHTVKDLETRDPKKFFCKEWAELEGRVVVDPVKWKQILTKGVDLLIEEKAVK